MGNGSTDHLRCNTSTINSYSDRRDKTDIVDLPIGLDFVNDLNPVQYKHGQYHVNPLGKILR